MKTAIPGGYVILNAVIASPLGCCGSIIAPRQSRHTAFAGFRLIPARFNHLRGVFTCSSGWLQRRQQRQHLKSDFARLAIRRGLGRSGST
jgi:hypothetical protein